MLLTSLRPYQGRAKGEAVTALRGGGGFLLIPEQRTGKCLISFAVIEEIKPKFILVVCPKVAIKEWRRQYATHVKPGTMPKFTVVNYEQVLNNRKHWYAWIKEHPDCLIIADEAHYMKKRGASRSRVVRHMARYAKYRLALTGTPIAQGLIDAWALFDFIDPEIFGRFDNTVDNDTNEVLEVGFNSKYIIWGGYQKHKITGYQHEDEFNEIFHQHSFRITLREARREGGKKPMILHYRKAFFDLERKSQTIYDELEETLEAEVNQKKIKVKNVLACVMKLQQITGGFVIEHVQEPNGPLWRRTHPVGHEKAEKLREAVRSLPARQKFIVICRFLHEIDAVAFYLKKTGLSVAVVAGGSPYDGVFATDAIVMQIQSGMAVDMSKAHTIILYSADYSLINFEQAKFRILSYDKEETGRYIFLLARGTVDEIIYEAVSRKKKLADLVIDKYRTRGIKNG